MARKVRSTRRQKGASKPIALKKETTATKSEKSDEAWGPIGTVAKKAAKGAVKGAAKVMLK